MSSDALCAGRHQGPNIDGVVPGSVGAVQHAALPGVCASVQRSWLQAYQRDDEALNAKGIVYFSHSFTGHHLVHNHIPLDRIGRSVHEPHLNSRSFPHMH